MSTGEKWILVLLILVFIVVLLLIILNAVFTWTTIKELNDNINNIISTVDRTAFAVQQAAKTTIKLENNLESLIPVISKDVISTAKKILDDASDLNTELQNGICTGITTLAGNSDSTISTIFTSLECLCVNNLLQPNNCLNSNAANNPSLSMMNMELPQYTNWNAINYYQS